MTNETDETPECGHLVPENGDGTCILCGSVVVVEEDGDDC